MKIKTILNDQGFSLIELVLAISMLALILVLFLNLFLRGYSSTVKAKRMTIATILAQEKIEELRANFAQVPVAESRGLVDEFSEYQREVIAIQVNGEKALWEVKVNVYWLEGKKENKVKLSTYFTER